jgi:hypothetical protein
LKESRDSMMKSRGSWASSRNRLMKTSRRMMAQAQTNTKIDSVSRESTKTHHRSHSWAITNYSIQVSLTV